MRHDVRLTPPLPSAPNCVLPSFRRPAERATSGLGASTSAPAAQRSKPAADDAMAPGPKAWWSPMFVRAGRMGSIQKELKGKKKDITVNGFKEKDQEDLYEQVRAVACWDGLQSGSRVRLCGHVMTQSGCCSP